MNVGGDPRWPTATIRLWCPLPDRARLEVSSRTNLKPAIWKLLSWASLRWQQRCLSHGLRLVCWTGFGACHRRYVSFSHLPPRRSPNLSLSLSLTLSLSLSLSRSPNLSPSRRFSLHATRHARARLCRLG